MTKMLSVSGGFAPPDPLTKGSVPGPRWGLCPRPPLYARAPHSPWCPQPLTPFRRLRISGLSTQFEAFPLYLPRCRPRPSLLGYSNFPSRAHFVPFLPSSGSNILSPFLRSQTRHCMTPRPQIENGNFMNFNFN